MEIVIKAKIYSHVYIILRCLLLRTGDCWKLLDQRLCTRPVPLAATHLTGKLFLFLRLLVFRGHLVILECLDVRYAEGHTLSWPDYFFLVFFRAVHQASRVRSAGLRRCSPDQRVVWLSVAPSVSRGPATFFSLRCLFIFRIVTGVFSVLKSVGP